MGKKGCCQFLGGNTQQKKAVERRSCLDAGKIWSRATTFANWPSTAVHCEVRTCMSLHRDCSRTKDSPYGAWSRGRSSRADRPNRASRPSYQGPYRTSCRDFAPRSREANGASSPKQIPSRPCCIEVKLALPLRREPRGPKPKLRQPQIWKMAGEPAPIAPIFASGWENT